MTTPNANPVIRSIEDAQKPRKAGIRTVRMDTVAPQAIDWLWFPYIALGKLSVIAGHPGLGKSLLSMSFAGNVTTGRPWVDGTPCPQGSVVLVSGEDDPGDTIRPRLDAAGADVSRVHYLRAVAEVDGERGFTLADVGYLDELMKDLGDCKLIVIDPVSAYMSGVDTHNNADVRGLLTPLAQMAADYRVAMVCVSHLNKGAGEAINRVTGSLALVAAARAAYAVTRCKEDETRRLVLPIKNNLGNDTGGLSYRIAAERDVPYVAWDREKVTGISIEDAMRPAEQAGGERTAVDDAEDFLREMLGGGSMPSKQLRAEANAAGVSWMSCERAKARMAITVKRYNDGNGGKGYWAWALAGERATPPAPNDGLDGLEGEGETARSVGRLARPSPDGLATDVDGLAGAATPYTHAHLEHVEHLPWAPTPAEAIQGAHHEHLPEHLQGQDDEEVVDI
jgi:hypothetical protein